MNFLGYNIEKRFKDNPTCGACGNMAEEYPELPLVGERSYLICIPCQSMVWECDCRDWREDGRES